MESLRYLIGREQGTVKKKVYITRCKRKVEEKNMKRQRWEKEYSNTKGKEKRGHLWKRESKKEVKMNEDLERWKDKLIWMII